MQMILLIILATCMMLGFAKLEISAGKSPDYAVHYARLRNTGVVTLTENVSCTTEGVSVINCTSYQLCMNVSGIGLIGAVFTCPAPLKLDPITYNCSSTYVCSTCTAPGFVCPTITTFTLCAAAGVPYASNTPCPTNYYCNEKCSSQCLNHIPDC